MDYESTEDSGDLVLNGDLPNRPSSLIRVAIADLIATEKDGRFAVEMERWYVRKDRTECSVCLAGAVMVQRTPFVKMQAQLEHFQSITPYSYPYYIRHLLEALDNFRQGLFVSGIMMCRMAGFNSDSTRGLLGNFTQIAKPTPYKVSPALFKSEMLAAADTLEALGA